MTSTDAPVALTATMSDALGEMVDALVGIDAMISGLMSARTQLLESMQVWSELTEAAAPVSTPASRDIAFRSLRAEVSCALRLPERTVEGLFGEARMLVRSLPGTLHALTAGEITYRHAQVMVEEGSGLKAEHLEVFERLAVPVAATTTVAAFGRAARKVRESLDPSTLEQRTREAEEKREVSLLPGRDGMADLLLHVPAHQALAAYSRANEQAMRMRGPHEPRTLAQLRVDVMVDALLNGTFEALGGRRVRPDVFVTVPVLSLLGKSDVPANLDGYGPIAISTAKELAAEAPSFVRILTHPETGAVLSVGRERYRCPEDLKNAKRVRDGTCGMPTCSRPAEFCDLDHIVDWALDGTTSLNNLAFVCRGHHTLKHATRWGYTAHPDAGYEWTTPAGKRYKNHPEGMV